MGFRDDRDALRQRIADLEAEVDLARRELHEARQAAPRGRSTRPALVIVVVVAVAVAGGVAALLTMQSGSGSNDTAQGRPYRMTGSLARDTCGGNVGLAEGTLFLDPDAHALYDPRFERVFTVEESGNGVLIEGRFFVSTGCPEPALTERWTLKRDDTGKLEGQLAARWAMPPNCASPCESVFDIVLAPE